MIRKLFLILFLLTSKCLILNGQNEPKNPVNISIKPQYGLILPHSSKVEHLSHTNPFGVEIDYSWLMLKDKNWQQCNCFSKAGISFSYVNYANPEIVGSSYNIIGFAEPFFIRSNRFLFSARIGFGASYLDKIYDSEDNPENTFFSTHLSFIAHIDINAYYQLSNRYSLMSYVKYNHISNGGVKQPNYGMNFPMFGLGLSYYPSGKVVFPDRKKGEFVSEYFFNIYTFGMIKKINENEYFPEETTYVFGLYGLAGKTISKVNGFSIGVEYINDGGAKEEIARKGLALDHQNVSGLIGHHLLFGKFDFSQYWGTYIYARYKSDNFYQRYSLSYKFTKHILGGVTLKAHGDIADSFHILIGVSF
jgi:Lipid A 3-O-deacylase (PagL)